MIGIHPTFNTSKRNDLSIKQNPVNFTGLTRTLSKKAYDSALAIKQEGIKHAKSNGIVGNLPDEWVQKIPKADRKVKIQAFYNSLKEIINQFRYNSKEEKAAQSITNALRKAGIVEGDKNISLKFLDSGERGAAYRIKGISDNKYILKIFDTNDFTEKFDENLSRGHGNFIEPNRAVFWHKNAGKNQMAPYYFGDINSGYMVNQFIRRRGPEYNGKNVPDRQLGLMNHDCARESDGLNKIRGRVIEYGGSYVRSKALSTNKTARYVYKKIDEMAEEKRVAGFIKFLGMKKYRNNKDIKLGLAASMELLLVSEKEKFRIYNQFLEIPDTRVKEVLAEKLVYVPRDKRLETWKTISSGANNDVKAMLIKQLDLLKSEQRMEVVDSILDGANNDVKKRLSNKLRSFSEIDMYKVVKKIYKTGDAELQEYLFKRYGNYCLPIT